VLVVALGVAVFLPALGREIGVDDREARHAEIAREMVQRGDYLVPHVLGEPYVDKPPLFNITLALMFQLTGRVDFLTARLPGALCSIAMALAIYVLGRRWYGARAGLWAAVIWATSWLVVEWGRTARMDMMMAGLILFGILLADAAVTAARKQARAILWCAASLLIAGGVLSKGPQALFFFVVVFVFMWRVRRGRWLAPVQYWAALVVIAAGLWAGWAIVTEIRDPGHFRAMLKYWNEVGVKGHLKRPWLYFDQMLIRTAPWSLFSVGAIYWLVRRLRRSGLDLAAAPFLAFAISIVVMTFIPNKREHYLLPILPLWSLFLAGFLDGAVSQRQRGSTPDGGSERPIPRWAFEIPLYVCLVGFALLLPAGAAAWILSKHAGKGIGVAVLSAAFASAAAGLYFGWRGARVSPASPARAVALLMLTVAILAASSMPVIRWFIDKRPPQIEMYAEIASALGSPARPSLGAPIGEFGVDDEYLFFKINRDVAFLRNKMKLSEYLKAPGERCLIVRTASMNEIRPLLSRPALEVKDWQAGTDSKNAISLLVISP